jgi:hypothetical protein
MANPFYIQRPQTFGNAVNTIENLRAKAVAENLAQGNQDLDRQRVAIAQHQSEVEYGPMQNTGAPSTIPGTNLTAPRQSGLAERRMTVAEQQAENEAAKGPYHQRNFSLGPVVAWKAMLPEIDKEGLKDVIPYVETLAKDAKVDNATAFNMMAGNWQNLQEKAVTGYTKIYEKKVAEDPAWAQTPEAKKVLAKIDVFTNDPDGKNILGAIPIFGETIRSIKMEEANKAKALPHYPAGSWIQTDKGMVQVPKENTPSNLGKLIQEMNALPADDPNKAAYRGAIQKQAQAEGMQLTTNADGTFTLTQGPLGSGGLTKPVQADLQKKVVNTTENIARLEAIGQQFDPAFMDIESRFGATKTKWKEKLGMDVSPEEKAQLSRFSAFSRDAIENINSYIKEITGAQMSEKEADRIRKAMPDPGEGIFDGDSPTEFKGKWRSAMKALKLSQARTTYLLKNGVTESALKGMAKTNTLPSFGQIEENIKIRNAQIEQETIAANPGISQQQIDAMVAQQLKNEFGI